jgi:hypothetical protein
MIAALAAIFCAPARQALSDYDDEGFHRDDRRLWHLHRQLFRLCIWRREAQVSRRSRGTRPAQERVG